MVFFYFIILTKVSKFWGSGFSCPAAPTAPCASPTPHLRREEVAPEHPVGGDSAEGDPLLFPVCPGATEPSRSHMIITELTEVLTCMFRVSPYSNTRR